MTPPIKVTPDEVAKNLTSAQRQAIIDDLPDYLRGFTPKLIRIAPGWASREWNDLGTAVRQHLITEGIGA